MARKQKPSRSSARKSASPLGINLSMDGLRSEILFFGLLVSALGLIWLLSDTGLIPAKMSLPPVIVLITGLELVFLAIKYHKSSI